MDFSSTPKIINLGLSPKISNIDDVALTVMWPSTSTPITLVKEGVIEEGTRRTTKEGGGWQSGGGSGPVEMAAAVIAPSPLPDVAGGEAADLGGCRATARRRRQRRGKAAVAVIAPSPLPDVARGEVRPGGGGCSRDSALPSARCSRMGGGGPRRLLGDGPVEAVAAWEGHRHLPSFSPSHHLPIGARAARSGMPHPHWRSGTAKSGIAPPHRRLGVARSGGGGQGGWAQGTLAVVEAGRGWRLPQRCSGLPPQQCSLLVFDFVVVV
uniref:Uncharacterized protein n=1 Tax=Oryza nivara TaxID=4536 RepID=A0A0E0IHT2_ORYNI